MSHDHRPKGAPDLSFKISDDALRGHYSNFALISHTRDEIVLDFAANLPPQPIVSSRIILSPLNAKRLLIALGNNLQQYEAAHGTIHLDDGATPSPSTGFVN